MGLFSQDRPRIPGDPPHLEIMTKIGHALPNAARKTLAASAYVGKGRIKDAVRVMKRKSIPKLEEGIVDKIKKWNASGKKRTRYDGNDPYEDAPAQDIKKTMKEEKKSDGYRDGKLQMVDQKRYKTDKAYKKDYDRGSAKTVGRTAAKYGSIDTRPAGKRHLPRGVNEGRTAGEDIDAHISRNAERADHHTNEYLGNPKGIQSAEHSAKADRHTAVYQRLKQYKKTGKIHEGLISNIKNRLSGKRSRVMKKVEKKGKNAFGDSIKSMERSLNYINKNLSTKSNKAERESAKKDADAAYKKSNISTNWRLRGEEPKRLSKFMTKPASKFVEKPKDKYRIKTKKLDESIIKKIKRAFNKVTGIQRAGLHHKNDKDYKDNEKRVQDYHEIARDYDNEYRKKKTKYTKNSADYYDGKYRERVKRRDDLNRRSWKIEDAGRKKLQEAVSRKLIAKKNAEKQRLKYVTRKGEMPPIITPKSRFKFTNKEVNKLSGVLDKQKSRRAEVKALAMEIKKGVKTKVNVPAVPVSSRATSVSTFAKLPTPGFHVQNSQPHVNDPATDPVRAHQTAPKKSDKEGDLLRGFNTWSGEFAKSGNPRHLELAKTAALAHYAAMIAKISHHPGHADYDTARAHADTMLNAHMSALNRLKDHVPEKVEAPKKKGFLSRIKGMFKESDDVDKKARENAARLVSTSEKIDELLRKKREAREKKKSGK